MMLADTNVWSLAYRSGTDPANDLTLLTADDDFSLACRHIPLDVWVPA